MWDDLINQSQEAITQVQDAPASSLTPDNDFLQTLSKRATRDGNPPKRRGPKPNSKPALTRRQELNRQAQRTHRERKELYIKALEDEVLRLREAFSRISMDNQNREGENRYLRGILTQHGITVSISDGLVSQDTEGNEIHRSLLNSESDIISGSQRALTPPLTSQTTSASMSPPAVDPLPWLGAATQGQRFLTATTANTSATGGIDYNQAGIDFVLTLEQPCMKHLPWLLDWAAEKTGKPCGHALMASCPPRPFGKLDGDTPFGGHVLQNGTRETSISYATWKPSRVDLATLLNLSNRLDLDGEITPVMSWSIVTSHPRFLELREQDMIRLAHDLKDKIRCYGFGAVLEEFEVRDALENVLSGRLDHPLC